MSLLYIKKRPCTQAYRKRFDVVHSSRKFPLRARPTLKRFATWEFQETRPTCVHRVDRRLTTQLVIIRWFALSIRRTMRCLFKVYAAGDVHQLIKPVTSGLYCDQKVRFWIRAKPRGFFFLNKYNNTYGINRPGTVERKIAVVREGNNNPKTSVE